jgi:hypothetical protein
MEFFVPTQKDADLGSMAYLDNQNTSKQGSDAIHLTEMMSTHGMDAATYMLPSQSAYPDTLNIYLCAHVQAIR